ncbi:MAG TPA: glycosyl hydrolase family protein [Spirochaetia bacterium]|nr:glycosyl hydrolase family protein [Spirochaetia bacterium]
MRRTAMLATAIVMAACTSDPVADQSLPPKDEPTAWQLVWAEEFDYTGLPDPRIWEFETDGNAWGWGNGEDQYYTAGRLQNARVGGGVLTITARKEAYADGFDYTSARIRTRHRADWLYGKFQIRAKLPAGQGIWPAIWMMPSDGVYGGWPDSGEIDIMEFFGFDPGYIHHNIHTEKYNHKIGTNKGTRARTDGLHTNFQIYELQWYPDRLEYYVDGKKNFTYRKESDDPAVWPYDRPFYMILNCAVGGDWMRQNGGIDDAIFPQQMIVDYVRVYQRVHPGRHRLTAPTEAGGKIIIRPLKTDYDPNEKIEITAVPAPGYRFYGWSGELTGARNPRTLFMVRDRRVDAVFLADNQLIVNGDFTRGKTHWVYWTQKPEVRSRHGIENGSFQATIDRPGDHDWQAQLHQAVALTAGEELQLTFAARAGRGRTLRVTLVQNHDPYHSFWGTDVDLEKEWRTYSFTITIPESDPQSRLEFDFGDAAGKIYIDDVSLKRIGLK